MIAQAQAVLLVICPALLIVAAYPASSLVRALTAVAPL